MKKQKGKKIRSYVLYSLLLLTVVLAIHIYVVTRPHTYSDTTRVMARIDIKQPINESDGKNITSWLYQQQGVDHVLCNVKSGIVVFTYFPVKANADVIAANFRSAMHMNAARFMPTEEQMKSGCPLATPALTTAVNYFKQLF